jgi:ectoine hydroxylase-related dioxygenase (phytanoyl-CoA dioxygenase family)
MSTTRTALDLGHAREAFRKDGVVLLKEVFSASDLALAKQAFDWSIAHPTPAAQHYYPRPGATFLQDSYNVESWPLYTKFITESGLSSLVARILNTRQMWFFFEQIFLKSGDDVRRTPWHQDLPYLPVDGSQFAVVWMSLDPVSKANALEFIPGSHLGTSYNPTSFDPKDDTDPFFEEGPMPRLPDIEANRDAWRINSWATDPGDAIVFHPGIMHGGTATAAGTTRRTLSLRFLGDDVTYGYRPKMKAGADIGVDKDGRPKRDMSSVYAGFKPGDSFRPKSLIRLLGS